jgi:hypothetical protein
MKEQSQNFNRNQLALAVSIALLGGVMTGCSSSSDSAAPPGESTISMNGGMGGAGGNGGDGGDLYIYNEGGTGGVQVKKAGVANTNFTSPINPAAAEFGDRPLEISVDTLIALVVGFSSPVLDGGLTTAGEPYVGDDDIIRIAEGAAANYGTDAKLADGTPYVRDSEDGTRRVYIKSAEKANDDNYATGMSVAEGAIATIDGNSGCNVDIVFPADIENNGTISRRDGDEGCYMSLTANKYIAEGDVYNAGVESNTSGGGVGIYTATGIANMGDIDVSGYTETETANVSGGNGGEIQLDADGYIINDGMLNAAGGDGTEGGGYGGWISLGAAYTENNGALHAPAGTYPDADTVLASTAFGGNINIWAEFVANNTGPVDISGGNGSTGGGAGSFYMSNSDKGEVKNAGGIIGTGGSGAQGDGGTGGSVSMYAYGGALLNNADINVPGGNSTFLDGDGGEGGSIYAQTDYTGAHEAGDLVFSGNLWVNGGDAVGDDNGVQGDGGDAGEIDMYVYGDADNGKPYNQKLALLGYAGITADGGDGGDGGGADDGIYFETDYADDQSKGGTVYAGSITNDVPLSAKGGNSTLDQANFDLLAADGDGGDGGDVEFDAADDNEVNLLNITATNNADVDVSGGDATALRPDGEDIFNDAGHGGDFDMYAYKTVQNTGAVDGSGGDNGFDDGGDGADVYLSSEAAQASNTGEINLGGSDAGLYGGDGGDFDVMGATASNNQPVDVSGGNATATDTVAYESIEGGDGGYVAIMGQGIEPGLSINSGEVNYTFGTGATMDGEEGCLQVGITFEGNCTGSGPK